MTPPSSTHAPPPPHHGAPPPPLGRRRHTPGQRDAGRLLPCALPRESVSGNFSRRHVLGAPNNNNNKKINKDKTEVYHWPEDYNREPLRWQHQVIPVRPPILTYLGHVLAHPTQEDTTWDIGTPQLHHDIAAYRTLPLNAYEEVAIINAVLIPRWTYRGLFLGNRARMPLSDDILLQYIKNTPGIQRQMNKHQLTTNLSHGGLGLR